MKRYFTCDTHADTLMRMIDLGYKIDDERLQVSIPKMLSGGHDLQVFACFIDPLIGKERYVLRTLQMIDLLRQEVAKHRKEISLCESASQIKAARARKKKIAMLGIEGGHAIVNDLSILRNYRRLGVIYMTLTWYNTNDWADAAGGEERWSGLTAFGHDVVREMNRIGMFVDISHVSDKTFWHALRASSKPIIASHSSVRSICKHHRNMTDEMIKALAEKGGVVFVNFFSAFIDQNFSNAFAALNKKMKRKLNQAQEKWKHRPEMAGYAEEDILLTKSNFLPAVKMQHVVKHIEYVAKIAGVESVGFGSDFDGTSFMPKDVQDCTAFPQLCDALRKRGFKPSEIDKIAGGNFLRVFAEVVG